MAKLTTAQQQIVGDWLEPMNRLVASKLGREAVEYVGQALTEIVPLYTSARGDLKKYIETKVLFKVVDLMRSYEGRKGTARHAGQSGQVELADYDEVDSSAADVEDDSMRDVLRVLNQTRGLPRWVLLCRVLGDLKNNAIEKVLNASNRNICRQQDALRGLLQPAGLHDDLRRHSRSPAGSLSPES